MATRTSKKSNLGKAQGWGIAQRLLNGSYELVAVGLGRQSIRDLKREVYPGGEYKTVKINATLIAYTK